MKVMIVDDEPLARRRLERMLKGLEGIEVVGTASDGSQARDRLSTLAPDAVLLDIDMPECDGLTLAATTNLPAVIFVTAHREHALEAFGLDAVDYLLKPVSRDRLRQALERARSRRSLIPQRAAPSERVDRGRPPRLTARTGDTLHVFDAVAVQRLHARDKVTMFWVDGVEYILDDSLAEMERRLAAWDFVRVHRAELVNLAAVVSVRIGAGESTVNLRDGSRVPVSRRLLPDLKRRLRGGG
ncbi:MAG: LytR/AlgR family response regulator transcription factor [Nannocystales bacterium]